MVVIDTHLARGASNGGFTLHDRGGPYGRTKGAKRVVAVDVTGLPVGALVVPASTHQNRTSEVLLEHLTRQGVRGAARAGRGGPRRHRGRRTRARPMPGPRGAAGRGGGGGGRGSADTPPPARWGGPPPAGGAP